MILSYFLLFSLQAWTLSSQTFRPLLVDTDADIDDLWAIAYLLKKGVELKAITAGSNGWSDPVFSVPNIMHLVETTGCCLDSIPIGYGANLFTTMLDPSIGTGIVPANLKVAIDRYFTSCLGETIDLDNQPSPYSAVELIIDVLSSSDEPLDVLLLGTFTNLAQALIQDRSIKNKINKVYFSGGNYDGRPVKPANWPYTTKTKGSSWNVFADPLAAQRIFDSGLDIIMITSQAQDDLPVSVAVAQAQVDQYKVDKRWFDMVVRLAPCSNQSESDINYWDPSAAIIAVQLGSGARDDQTICDEWVTNTSIVVLQDGGMFGRTITSPNGKTVKFCKHANLQKYLAEFWPTMAKKATNCNRPYVVTPPPSTEELADKLDTALAQIKSLQIQINHLTARLNSERRKQR